MDLIDQLKQLASRAEQIKDKISTEEATKTSLILPFFQLLGYDIFNPLEFVPEYTADVGIKKGERVDYAIMKDNNPIILIEAKWCNEQLQSHDSQLFRYFGTSTAKFAILTNGIIYRFYTDLDESNKMDLVPFMEINLCDLKDELIPELKKFSNGNLDIDAIFSSASDLKYTNSIKQVLNKQLNSPDEAFVKYVLSEVYTGRQTQQVIEKFTGIIKKSLTQWINNIINEKFQNALQNSNQEGTDSDATCDNIKKVDETNDETESKIITSVFEFEAYATVKSILHGVIPFELVTYKDTETYFSVLYNNNTRKWICRLYLDWQKKSIVIPDTNNQNGVRYYIDSINNIYDYSEKLIESAKRFI